MRQRNKTHQWYTKKKQDNIVLDLNKIIYEKVEDKRKRIIMRTAHQFLQNFCFSNQHNQSLLHEKIDLTNYLMS